MDARYEMVRQAAVTLGVSLVVAAGIIGWSLPDAPSAPRYQGFVVDGKIVRLNTRDGNIVACDFDRCVRVLGNGKQLQSNSAPGLAASGEGAAAPAQPRLPAPAAPQGKR
jgi:hypothetical protein